MTKNVLNAAFHPMKPDAQQKERMLAAIRRAGQPQAGRERRPLGPVSYTHLDVYKRQIGS